MLEKVPQELKNLKQWVCAYKGSKAPMRPFERAGASTTDPSTWGDFETACEALSLGYYDYAGFVFADNGIVGIDIDAGYDEDGLPTQEALDILTHCRGYTEKSRSGRGFHIFLKGDLPFDGQNNGRGVEIYKHKRYFIMTGKQICWADLREDQEAIDYVLARYFGRAAPVEDKPGKPQTGPKIYSLKYDRPDASGRLSLSPTYPEISHGSRHISMVSLAGTLRNAGYDADYVYQELLKVNQQACKPPLPVNEIQQIMRSMRKYG